VTTCCLNEFLLKNGIVRFTEELTGKGETGFKVGIKIINEKINFSLSIAVLFGSGNVNHSTL